MLLHMVSQDIGMLKIPPIDWTEAASETRMSSWETQWRVTGTQWRLANQSPVPVLRDYVHAFIGIHFKTVDRGTIIFGFDTSMALRASKPCASTNLYKIVLFFLTLA